MFRTYCSFLYPPLPSLLCIVSTTPPVLSNPKPSLKSAERRAVVMGGLLCPDEIRNQPTAFHKSKGGGHRQIREASEPAPKITPETRASWEGRDA